MGPSAPCPQACGIIPPVFPCAGQEWEMWGQEEMRTPCSHSMGCGAGEGTLAGGTVPGESHLPPPSPGKDWRWNCPSVALEPECSSKKQSRKNKIRSAACCECCTEMGFYRDASH